MSLWPMFRWRFITPFAAACALLFSTWLLPGPAFAEDDCIPLKPREVQLLVAEAEDFLSAGVTGDAIESANRGEEILTCLSDSVAPSDLGDLFLVKGAAYHRTGSRGRSRAEASFTQAFTVYPEGDCDVPGITSGGRSLCEKLRVKVTGADPLRYVLSDYHSGALVYVDGIRLRPSGREITIDLLPGVHFLQVQGPVGFDTQRITVGEGQTQMSLIDILGPPPAEAEGPARGSLRLEGLPPDAKVVVDGRERRDLPLLEQLDPGEHYVKVNSMSSGMMGFTVSVNAGEETVYAVVFESTSGGGGGGGGRLPAFVALGVSGVSVLGAGGSFALAGVNYSQANEAYESYKGLSEPEAVVAKYNEAADLQGMGNTWQVVGWGLAGAAVVSGGLGAFLLMRGRESTARAPVKVLPFATAANGHAQAAVLISGVF